MAAVEERSGRFRIRPQEGQGQDADGLIVAIAQLVGGRCFRHA
jgi:hypothetical protein